MLSLFTRSGYRVGVAHCNFQLRGAESDEDEVLVEEEADVYKRQAADNAACPRKQRVSGGVHKSEQRRQNRPSDLLRASRQAPITPARSPSDERDVYKR